jgi:hypothetical protein
MLPFFRHANGPDVALVRPWKHHLSRLRLCRRAARAFTFR